MHEIQTVQVRVYVSNTTMNSINYKLCNNIRADDQVTVVTTEDNLQMALYKLNILSTI